jgi:hypothetical protein
MNRKIPSHSSNSLITQCCIGTLWECEVTILARPNNHFPPTSSHFRYHPLVETHVLQAKFQEYSDSWSIGNPKNKQAQQSGPIDLTPAPPL